MLGRMIKFESLTDRSKLKPIPASDDDYLRTYKTEKKQQELDELVAEQRRRLSLKLIL